MFFCVLLSFGMGSYGSDVVGEGVEVRLRFLRGCGVDVRGEGEFLPG